MRFHQISFCQTSLLVTACLFLLTAISCSSGDSPSSLGSIGSTPSAPPSSDAPPASNLYSERAEGIIFNGPLAGKSAYFLSPEINRPDCWVDSLHWTGENLFFAITSTRFTGLIANSPEVVFDSACQLPTNHRRIKFDIYKANALDSGWDIQNQTSLNSNEHEAGMSVSGNSIAYTVYYDSADWQIMLARKEGNSWSAAAGFSRNSSCQEDNPELYANGTRMIFESTSALPYNSACNDTEAKRLWYSESVNGSWSEPILLNGPPNQGSKNTQPWVDEEEGFLYWTADTECGCVRRMQFDGKQVVGNDFETVITPFYQPPGTDLDGKVIFAGEFSQSNGYAFFSCALAERRGSGSDPHLYRGEYLVSVRGCIVPLS